MCPASTLQSNAEHGPAQDLHHTSYNPSGKSTVVLIHGAFTSGGNWDLVVPHLTESYHVLVPDLPGHGPSRNIPFTVEVSSRLIAQLIRKHAITGIAHVVGHSLGSHVAINLASTYPEVVNAMFVSGFEIYPPTAMTALIPYSIWAEQRIEFLIPRRLVSWLMDGADLPRGELCSMELCSQIVASPMMGTRWPSSWPARTLIVAAGKSGILPSSDHPHDAVRLMVIGRERSPETIAVTHKAMRHPWNRQAPALFAETARAWFEREDIPVGFEKL